MGTPASAVIPLVIALSAATARLPQDAPWLEFRSSTGFTVDYPPNWFRDGISTEGLSILSAKHGAEAVIIRPGIADIVVIQPPDSIGPEITNVIRRYTRGVVLDSEWEVPVVPATGSCERLRGVTFRAPIIPPEDATGEVPVAVNTLLVCRVKQRVVVTIERHIAGDRKQAYYRDVATQMARSIKALLRQAPDGR